MYINVSMSVNYSHNEKCFRKKVVDKLETHTLCLTTYFFFFSKIVLFEIMWKKYGSERQANEDNLG